MFRDRLRLWGMNDKNRRKVPYNCRMIVGSVGSGGRISSQREARYQTLSTNLWMRLLIDARIRDTLSVPKEFQSWQRALKGLLDWQQSLQDSAVEIDEDLLRDDSWTFYDLLVDMRNTTSLIRSNPQICKSATRRLEKISAAISNHLKSTDTRATTLAVLRAVSPLQFLAGGRDSNEWCNTTSEFLLRAAAETLPVCHPTLLFMKALLLDGSVSEGLAIVYELGFDIIQRYLDESRATTFRYDVVTGALNNDPDAAIGSHVDSLCTYASNSNDAVGYVCIASMFRVRGRFAEAAHFAQRCLARVQDLGEQNSMAAANAWWILSRSQRRQRDVMGEEESLRNTHALTLAEASDTNNGLELSIHVLRSISKLYRFYERNQLEEKCRALRAEYPSAFEL
jgi:hypothetical protein